MKLDPYLIPYIQSDSKWINGLDMKGKSIKFLEEHIGVNLNDLGFGDRFLDMAPKHEQQTKKKKKSDFIKINFVPQSTLSRN